MRIKLIVNPRAGICRGEVTASLLSEIEGKLKESGCEVDLFITKNKGDALMEARASLNYEAIVVAGGDGTVNEVVNGIIGTSFRPAPTLGVIPLGTVNLFASELGIPEDPLEACDVILNGKVKEIDLGKAGDHYFTLMAGVGFDAKVVASVMPEMKRVLGASSYLLTGIKTLANYKPTQMAIKIDDKTETIGYFVVISNAKRYATEAIRIALNAEITDGVLDVCVFKKGKRHDFLRYTLGIIIRKLTNYPDIEYFRAKKIKITAKKPVLVHTDCEIIGSTPIEFTVLPRALKIVTR